MPKEVGVQTETTRWASRRWVIWSATWHMIKDHPLTGVGFGGYWMAITAYHDGSGEMVPQEAHNDWLEFVANGGLIGVALGVSFLYLFIRRVRGRRRTSDKFVRAARWGALLGLAGVAAHSLVDFGLHITLNAVVAVVLVAIATVDVRSSEHSSLANG
jgi:O-antigen ligase